MKKIILFIAILIISAKCGDCDHCGEGNGSTSKYAVINTLNNQVLLKIYGNDIMTQIKINHGDTSRNWERVILPAQLESKFFTLDQNNNGRSFPYDSDSIIVEIEHNVVKKYYVDGSFVDPDWETSIYNDLSAYEVIPPTELSNENLFSFYYLLDSVTLNLK